jgi:hypothetical protein
MVIDRRKAIVFGAAAALRLLLFFGFPSLPEFLTGRVEISTPITSFKRCMSLSGFVATTSVHADMSRTTSAGRSLSLHAQSIALRWRRLLSSKPKSSTVENKID